MILRLSLELKMHLNLSATERLLKFSSFTILSSHGVRSSLNLEQTNTKWFSFSTKLASLQVRHSLYFSSSFGL